MAHTITDNCTGCSVCSMKCPTGAISGEKKERFFINKNLCVDCHVCGWWCSKAAILDEDLNVVARKKPKEIIKAKVNSEECNGCGSCLEICYLNCIEFGEDTYSDNFHNKIAVVNEKKCIGCGLCANICIKDAISVSDEVAVV